MMDRIRYWAEWIYLNPRLLWVIVIALQALIVVGMFLTGQFSEFDRLAVAFVSGLTLLIAMAMTLPVGLVLGLAPHPELPYLHRFASMWGAVLVLWQLWLAAGMVYILVSRAL